MTDPINGPEDQCPEDGYQPPYSVEGEVREVWEDPDTGVNGPGTGGDGEDPAPNSSSSSSSEDDVFTFTYDELSLLCKDIGLSPEMINGVLAQLLTQHFADPSHFIYPELIDHGIYWTPSGATTRLIIKPAYEFDSQTAGKEPAIYYHDLGQVPQRIAIGDQFYHLPGAEDRQGFARAFSGQHRIMCIGESPYQASLLATELHRWLTQFSPWIINNLPFHDFQVMQREQPRPISDMGNRIGVAFGVSYTYIWSWELVPDVPPLKSLGYTNEY